MQTWFAEFLSSAILWGSLITGVLWWLRKRYTKPWPRRFLFLPFWWFVIHTAIAWYGFILPPSGTLLEADTGEPIKNTRVISTWISYPRSLWHTYCSGRQIHLTNEKGRFAFPLAPYTTLFYGVVLRGINPSVPGRIGNRQLNFSPIPIMHVFKMQRFAAGREANQSKANTGCNSINPPRPHIDPVILPGEDDPFEVMYREACIEKRVDTFTDQYMQNMERIYYFNSRAVRPKSIRNNPHITAVQSIWPQITAQAACPNGGGLCASEIDAHAHQVMCDYFTWLKTPEGKPQ